MSIVDEMLAKKIWAVVGVSADPGKFGYKVYHRLKKAGYTVYGVNPHLDSLNGDKVYPDLASLPEKPEVVNFVVPPTVTVEMLPKCVEQGIRYVWMQPGAECREAMAIAREHNVEALKSCVMTELRKRS